MKLTPLYQKHIDLGATMYTTAMGYAMPAYYTSVAEEARNVRARVGMNDVSLMGRLDLKGKDAVALTQYLIVNNAERLADNQALYSVMCDDEGRIIDDVVVMRFGAEHLRIITSSMFRARTLKYLQQQIEARRANVYATDVSSYYAMISVQGPRSREMLSGITDVDLSKLKFFRMAFGNFGKIPCMIARLGFSGELGYECYVNAEDAHATWDLFMSAGKPLGVMPYGMDTLDALRWEKGFIFYGFDAKDEHNPYECRVSDFIRYDCGDFRGREALLDIKQRGPAKKLMGLEVGGAKLAPEKQPLRIGSESVGHVVAGFHSANLDRNLAYAYVDAPHFKDGTQVSLEIDGIETSATVVEMPFLDPSGARMRA
ncbi:MAG TPA: aminomethyltransferase family protein [Myxococcota bacterium]|nr:aminomethyltransferase family protein [Myxococcota bacterium]